MQRQIREIQSILKGQAASDGAGVKLTRFFDSRLGAMMDPFLMLDEFRSDQADDYLAGFPSHPHRGFETVTYMMAGRMKHGDHLGNTGDLQAGSVQWMTAGRGIIHEEMPQQEHGLMWGYQLWVNLPSKDKMTAPMYQDIQPELIPEVSLPQGGRVRVLAGDYQGVQAAVAPRPTQALYWDVSLSAGQAFEANIPDGFTVLLLTIRGDVRVGERAQVLKPYHMALLKREGVVRVEADAVQDSQFLLIAGQPIGEPIAHYGPFVMNTRAEIEQAISDYQAGRF